MSDAKPQGRPAAKVQRRLRRDEALIEMVRAERVFLASRRLTKGPENPSRGARRSTESEKVTKPARSARGEFCKREILLFVLVMIAATVLTVWGTIYVLKTFVLHDPADPLKKAGGLSPVQEEALRRAPK